MLYNIFMINPLTWLSRRRFPYKPLITVEISRSALIHNLSEFQKIAPQNRVAPVLKSNAYGHGLLEVAGILEAHRNSKIPTAFKIPRSSADRLGTPPFSKGDFPTGIPFFVVDSYFEAVQLKANSIKTPLLIIGYTRPETILNSRLKNVSYTIGSLDSLKEIKSTAHPITIHLKIDTGMRRQGLLPSEIIEAIQILIENPLIRLDGICSHLCDSNNSDSTFTEHQIKLWNETVAKFRDKFRDIKYFHLSATDGHRYSGKIDANLSRLGLGLYGIADEFMPKLNLKPVMEMKTIITGIKVLKRGESIGYGNTFKTETDSKVATIPVGYYEGIDRRLSNIGFVSVGDSNIPCRIVGRVSMNITCIDISNVPDAKIGMAVKVISNNSEAENSIKSTAKKCQTILYEIVVHVPAHLKRIVID